MTNTVHIRKQGSRFLEPACAVSARVERQSLVTDNEAYVTCKRCLKRISERQAAARERDKSSL